MERPNVIFLIWDSCDRDTARNHAPALNELADSNVWFENAISPSAWSLPSHASFFTGEYPHEHRKLTGSDNIGLTKLGTELQTAGYHRFCVSSNGFASRTFDFDENFDTFWNTRGPRKYVDGIDIEELRLSLTGGVLSDATTVSKKILTHDHPLKSAVNVARGGISKLSSSDGWLRNIPHPLFQESGFTYNPALNTRKIEDVIRNQSATDSPFFIFSNYMDTHYPYLPSEKRQREFCGRTFSLAELKEVFSLAKPMEFMDRVVRGDVDEEILADMRCLYRAAVSTVDDHLRSILQTLDEEGMREETLVVVTADHGEEVATRPHVYEDRQRNKRLAERLYTTDELYRVPLVVANPAFSSEHVSEYVSIKDLYHLFRNATETVENGNSRLRTELRADGDPIMGQFPWIGYDERDVRSRYPNMPDSIIGRHIVVGYTDDWKFVTTSVGDESALKDGEAQSVDSVPEALKERCRTSMRTFIDEPQGEDLDDEMRSHLADLGYL